MRIIAGKYRSRKLAAPKGRDTRPTLDQVREAVFASLGGSFDSGAVFDPFAGTGAIGLEALSRGYTEAVLNDRDPEAVKAIKANCRSLGIGAECQVWSLDYHEAIDRTLREGRKFDLIYLDPPYALGRYPELLERLAGSLAPGGRLVVECLREERYEYDREKWYCYRSAAYGIMAVSCYIRRQ